jgi:uncharacterized protein YndB with AHSA1/START domain
MRMKITYGAILPVPIEEAFAYVTAPESWPQFSATTVQSLSGWGAVGGKAQIAQKFVGRPIVAELELVEWEPPVRFRYLTRTDGGPTLDNLRVFEEVVEGTRLVGTTEGDPRPGVRGIYDRFAGRLLQRVYDRAMLRMSEVIRQARRTG